MHSPLDDVKRSVYLWSYVLAEFVPFTRQRLHLTSIPERAKSDHCNSGSSSSSCRCTLDESSTRRLLLECTSRRLSLGSILLASLFLATSEAVRVENQQNDTTTRAGGLRGTAEKAMAMKLHKSLVLGVVCVVMAMLSGSVESKAMRYFCSLYAVVAGIWAVNVITIEKSGRTIVMATSTTIKVGVDAAEETFTPMRLSVDCGQDLWDTAERLHRQSRGMACSTSSYARFKMHMRHARRLGERQLERQGSPSEEAKLSDSTYRPLQLFGCIRLEGTDGNRTEHQLAPKETPPGSPSCTSMEMTTAVDGDGGMTFSSGVKTASISASALNEGGTPLRSELILTTLDSKYSLFYREKNVVIDGDSSDHEHGVPGTASGGEIEASKTLRRTAAPPLSPPLDQDESRSQSRLELTLVEGTRALRGSGSDWLLDRSKAILLQGIRHITGNDL